MHRVHPNVRLNAGKALLLAAFAVLAATPSSYAQDTCDQVADAARSIELYMGLFEHLSATTPRVTAPSVPAGHEMVLEMRCDSAGLFEGADFRITFEGTPAADAIGNTQLAMDVLATSAAPQGVLPRWSDMLELAIRRSPTEPGIAEVDVDSRYVARVLVERGIFTYQIERKRP